MAILNYTTKIAPEKTISEIQARLVKNGARKISFDYDEHGDLFALMFQIDIDQVPVFFQITPNIDGVLLAMQKDPVVPARLVNRTQATKVAWRIEKDWLEAQLAKIEAGLVSMLQLLLPYAVTQSGQTFFQQIQNGLDKTNLLMK